MKASESKLNDFLSGTKTAFVIPIYQRNYDWQDYHCSQLFTDILTVASDHERSSHFVGSIVYMHDGLYTEASVKELIVIDGQQRLTTLTLLYTALLHFAEDAGEEERADEIRETFLVNRYAKVRKEKLWQTAENERIYANIRNRQHPDEEPISRVRENYGYFRELLHDEETFESVLRGLAKLSFVEISLERGKDDPQRIFESLNSTGLALSQADLIRNYVLMGHNRERQQELYERYWQDIERSAKDDETRENLVSDFVRDFLTIVNKRISRQDKIYDAFKQRYYERSYDAVDRLLSELKRYAILYGRLVNPSRETHFGIRKRLVYLKQLEVLVSYPFLLQVYLDYEDKRIDDATFEQVISLVERYVWRRFLCEVPTNALNKVFSRLYAEVRFDEYVPSIERSLLRLKGTQRFPDDREVTTALKERDFYNIRGRNRVYLFSRLENFNNRELVDLDTLTIEHIFPQTPHSAWKTALSGADYEEFAERYLHQLANLTLSGNNGALGNKSFTAKRDMNVRGGEQGYRFSRLWLNRDLKDLDEWTLASFKKRQRRMVDRALKIWPYPTVAFLGPQEDKEEYTIFEVEDPTGRQIAQATIFDDVIEPKSVKEFYVSVIHMLFDRDRSALLRPDVANTILLHRNKKDARKGEHIGHGYYVDAANSSWVKFNRLETVLTAYDAEDAVRIKFKE